MSDDISNALGLTPLKPLPKKEVTGEVLEPAKKKSISEAPEEERDYAYARENFYNVIEKGTEALENMLDVARASEHPRAYEVVSTLMKTLVDANKDLVKMGEEKRKAQKEENGGDEKRVTNNNLFVGSTAELQQMLKDMRDGE